MRNSPWRSRWHTLYTSGFSEKRFSISGDQLAEEKKAQEERNKKLAEQEKEVAETRDNLRRLEFEFREKNAILEILLKVEF